MFPFIELVLVCAHGGLHFGLFVVVNECGFLELGVVDVEHHFSSLLCLFVTHSYSFY